MINLVNTYGLTLAQRRNSLQRALHSQPFFSRLDFSIDDPNVAYPSYSSKAQTDKDFYLTQVINGNYLDTPTGTESLNLVIANEGRNIFGYQAADLPIPFVSWTAIRNFFTMNNYCVKQSEIIPTLIKRNSTILGKMKPYAEKLEPTQTDVNVVLAGYYPLADSYLTDDVARGVNESLDKPISFDQWLIEVDYDGSKSHILSNDRYARLVLGFGIVPRSTFTQTTQLNSIRIVDTYRGIEFNTLPFDPQFIAPVVSTGEFNTARETQLYYLPVEYLWHPFAPLRFDIVNDLTNCADGYDFVMLTRTV